MRTILDEETNNFIFYFLYVYTKLLYFYLKTLRYNRKTDEFAKLIYWFMEWSKKSIGSIKVTNVTEWPIGNQQSFDEFCV
jgi:hypothetical protein